MNNIRIDILKIRQKLAKIYPANSIGRKNIIRSEKLRELQKLLSTRTLFPKEVVDTLLITNKDLIQISVLKLFGLLGLLSLQFVGIFLSIKVSFLLPFGFMIVSGYALAKIIFVISQMLELCINNRNMKKAQKEMNNRIEKLTKELDNV